MPLPSGASFDHQNVITEWRVDPGDRTGRYRLRPRLLRIDHPQSNHNGGQLAFGPDAFLYIGTGDGGSENDVGPGHSAQGNGQDTSNVLGKILRIDPLPPTLTADSVGAGQRQQPVSHPQRQPLRQRRRAAAEIFAYGFRNAYRFSFDPQTGNLHAGDVGQGTIEEIDVVTKGGNFGWPIKEGTFLFDPATGQATTYSPDSPAGLIDPVFQYDHTQGKAVIGGFVYRGSAISTLTGQYVFADFSRAPLSPAGRLFYAPPLAGPIRELLIGSPNRAIGLLVKGLGMDEQGELYVLGGATIGPSGTTGVVLKIVLVSTP